MLKIKHLLAQCQSGAPTSFRLDFCTKPSRREITLRFANGELIWNILEGIVSSSVDGKSKHIHKLGISADERFYRQLGLFWQYARPGHTAMCPLKEGLEVLDLVVQTRYLAANKNQ